MLNKCKHTKDTYSCICSRHLVIYQDTESACTETPVDAEPCSRCAHAVASLVHRQRHVPTHHCACLHGTEIHACTWTQPGHTLARIDTWCCQSPHSGQLVSVPGAVLSSLHVLPSLISTHILRGGDDNYPHLTGEETEIQRGAGTWRTTGNRRAGPLAQIGLPPRPGLTAVLCACLLDAMPHPVHRQTGASAQPTHTNTPRHAQRGAVAMSTACLSHTDMQVPRHTLRPTDIPVWG